MPHALLVDASFHPLKDWIIQRTGLSYYKDKNEDLILALERVFAQGGSMPPATVLLQRLRSDQSVLDALVEQLTIGETFFFRHLEMFHAMRDVVFPDLLRRKAHTRSLRIWCAGCSIGAEPYSIAILLRDFLGSAYEDWSVHILGTDINRKFLRMAEAGSYEPWSLRGVPPGILHQNFIKEEKRWRLKETCRKAVRFQSHNLALQPFPDVTLDLAGYDLIVCRNVMIYFDQPFIQRLSHQFYETLNPGGWLAVGHAEPHTETFRKFRTVNTPGAVLYQRGLQGESVDAIKTPYTPPVMPYVPPLRQTGMEAPPPPVMPMPELFPIPKPTTSAAANDSPLATPGLETEDEKLCEITRYADAGDLKQALQACDSVILHSPLSAGAYYYHGMILYQFGEWQAAERSLHRCLYLSRHLVLAHYYMGLVQERLGHSPKRHFGNALKLLADRPDDSPVPLGQGLTVREFRSLLMMPGLSAEAPSYQS
ncbi:chemotaxis protein methyltransferase CheR [Prosthecobacter fusiformis]|uniref:Chemotaxis protein methyltransferase CheR n=2 Tax=Prosthecobacter fusiformis TaxID=48464 RepID=A0A4R7RZE5_9BACT|nr:chemotaxis protein methyltransferase CheR [Prosthecobacter fusiformis]